jgi:hypothetical protein
MMSIFIYRPCPAEHVFTAATGELTTWLDNFVLAAFSASL